MFRCYGIFIFKDLKEWKMFEDCFIIDIFILGYYRVNVELINLCKKKNRFRKGNISCKLD